MKQMELYILVLISTIVFIGCETDRGGNNQTLENAEKQFGFNIDTEASNSGSIQTLEWFLSADAFSIAANENKTVLISVHTDWCSYCKKMERETYGNQKIIKELNSGYVCIKFNPDIHGRISIGEEVITQETFFSLIGLEAYPTTAFFTSSGKHIKTIRGYLSSANMFEALKQYKTELSNADIMEVSIGDQIWMSKNLNVEKFRNGDLIPEAKTDEEWIRAGENEQPAWCYYENDPKNGRKYGKLYNWYAINDPRGLAPKGWRIPTLDDVNQLFESVNWDTEKLKAFKKNSENNSDIAKKGFQGLPSGYRCGEGRFHGIMSNTFFWCIDNNNSEGANSTSEMQEYPEYDGSNLYFETLFKEYGRSVRCIKY